VLNSYNWTDYIVPGAWERFQKETGITVHYDVFDSLETLEAKLLAGHSGYDVVVPSNEPTFSRLIKVGALAPIDRARVPNWKNLDPVLMRKVESSDPGNRYGAIYLWGTTGIGLIADRVKRLAPDAPMDSWDLLFKQENAKRIAPCGITMMDSAIDVIPGVLKYLGKNPDSTDPADLAAVEATLMGVRHYIRSRLRRTVEALAAGQTCLALDYSGDVIQVTRAPEAKHGITVRYVAPKEGAQLGFDMLAGFRRMPSTETRR
jgi:putrescine transport system substrate-binding protein